jgi:pyruvate dehydrogenase E2 component (dihydrolipoamide acetyltransferase)
VATPTPAPVAAQASNSKAHASPSIRKFARELGVDLGVVAGSGPKGRITQEDVQNYVKGALAAGPVSAPVAAAPAAKGGGEGLGLLPWPSLDFSKFGTTTLQPLTRIKKISGPNLHRNWVMIPHVTQYDEADVTELEELRKSTNTAIAKSGVKLTILAFVIKACVAALKKYPEFNSSLDATGENLILKQYYNIGFAADTPQGLVVPVVKGVDQKTVTQIAQEMGELSAQARDGKLKGADMQGATFTISSLGGIGGTYFTPLINAPEVAIIGLSKTSMKPVWDGKQFVPRLIMPLSLSYDHRVIDGAQGARFVTYLSEVLTDLRKSLL